MERTFIAVKHDGVLRGLVGEIIKRFEQKGLKIAGMRMIHADRERAGNAGGIARGVSARDLEAGPGERRAAAGAEFRNEAVRLPAIGP